MEAETQRSITVLTVMLRENYYKLLKGKFLHSLKSHAAVFKSWIRICIEINDWIRIRIE